MAVTDVFYSEISQLRDLFHKYGRFDDSNAKLDEISKYISMYVYQLKHNYDKDNLKTLLEYYENNSGFDLVDRLKKIFDNISQEPEFLNQDGISIFGNNPTLNIEDGDNNFAYLLIKLVVRSIEGIKDHKNQYNFDILNESFGHFVRDNFRNHVEDAQYMTPNEVVEFMVDVSLHDLSSEDLDLRKEFVVCDPCCGVGSFLSYFYKKNKDNKVFDISHLKVVGQDKVARMVRLSKINMLLFDNNNHDITNGNSLSGGSPLDKYNGKVDLIITNPPFGAKFSGKELDKESNLRYPLLWDLFEKSTNFNSEILFIDRCISLLKPNGRLLAVLPDSVISSAGLNATIRHRLAKDNNIIIRAIIELPAVTFAQAGTRTKTSILYLEKTDSVSYNNNHTFIAHCNSIGFEVSTKKGATVKHSVGLNDLTEILNVYKSKSNFIEKKDCEILSEVPSCVLLNQNALSNGISWTPNHYNATKLSIEAQSESYSKDIKFVKLHDLANFITRDRKKEFRHPESKCISVLHIVNEDHLNYEELLTYQPKYPGIVCKEGDIIFSKINPRILRVLVVPKLGLHLTCSSEFEIMTSKTDLSNYALKLLLMNPSVQTQINHLTSGTSSSHNRIKSQDLANVLVPIPRLNSPLYDLFMKEVLDYERESILLDELNLNINRKKHSCFNLLS